MWALTLAFLTCLCVDFANPLLPGAVRFGDDASVDALHAERPRLESRTPPAHTRPGGPVRTIEPDRAPARVAAATADGFRARHNPVRPRGLIDTAQTAPASAEDH